MKAGLETRLFAFHAAVSLAFGAVLTATSAMMAAAAAPDLPVFPEGALSPALLAEAKDEVPHRLDSARVHLSALRGQLAETVGRCPDSFQWVRANKRMEVAERTLAFAVREHARGCLDGYAFALMAAEDLGKMLEALDEEVRLWKVYPLAPDVKPVVLHVADFGAKGDAVHDDGPAFRAAVSNAVALAGRPTVIEIPEGEFYFAPQPPRPNGSHKTHLRIAGLTNCVLRGVSPEKTLLRFGDYDGPGLWISRSENVTIANMDIAGTEVSFTQGEVLEFSKEAGWVRIRHQPGSMAPDDRRLVNGGRMQVLGIYDGNRRQVLHQEMFYANRTDNLGNGEYRIWLQKDHFIFKRPSSHLEKGWIITVGDRNGLIGRVGATTGARFCNFANVHVRNGRSAAINFMDSLYSTAWRVKIYPLRPELIQASDADAIFSYRGEFIGECEVSNLGDDAFNCMVRGRNIDRVENNDTIVAQWLPGHYEPGDLFLVVRPTTGEFVYLGRVKRPGRGDGDTHDTQFDSPLPELVSHKSLGKGRLLPEASFAINVKGAASSFSPDQMYRPYAFGVGMIVSGCTISNLRGTGCVVGTSGVLIENNVFENMNRGIGLSCLSNCTEGPTPFNVLIRNNLFRNVGTAVEGRFVALGGGRIRTAPIRGVRIEGNRYENVATPLNLDFCGDDAEIADCEEE